MNAHNLLAQAATPPDEEGVGLQKRLQAQIITKKRVKVKGRNIYTNAHTHAHSLR